MIINLLLISALSTEPRMLKKKTTSSSSSVVLTDTNNNTYTYAETGMEVTWQNSSNPFFNPTAGTYTTFGMHTTTQCTSNSDCDSWSASESHVGGIPCCMI
jgi:hypothetical protein